MKPIILKNHFNDEDVIVYDNYILHDFEVFEISSADQIEAFLGMTEMPLPLWEEVAKAIEAGEGNADTSEYLPKFALAYSEELGVTDYMRQIILDSRNTGCAYCWMQDFGYDEDMYQLLIDSKDPKFALWYCITANKDKDIDEQMRQIVLDARNPAWAYEWCLRVKNDDEMRQIFLDHLE